MRRLALIAALLGLALPVGAQVARSPRVEVTHERGPIPPRVLERAWPSRAFQRCIAEAPDDIVHVHVRIERDATVVIEHNLPGDIDEAAPARCVVEVILAARLPPQTEPTHAYVTVVFRPNLGSISYARDSHSAP